MTASNLVILRPPYNGLYKSFLLLTVGYVWQYL